MNYSTLKKSLAVSFVALMGVTSLANAQDATGSSSSAKVFGGRGQYRSWSFGINGGVLSPFVAIGGTNDFNKMDVNLGYGISLRKQLGHAFGLEGNIFRGKVSGSRQNATISPKEFETEIGYAADIRGVVNVATVDFLRRENSVNFFVTAGYGLIAYAPKVDGVDWKDKAIGDVNDRHDAKTYVKEAYIPVGAGVKFKVSERVSFNLGYTMHFIDGDNFDATYANGASNKDKFSYGYAGLEFSLGSKSKPNLDWVNPLALMYDELKDPSLRQEVEALKARVANVEQAVEGLKKDSDGDGVSDQFDKCPGTPAGTAVDGSGCPLPKMTETAPASNVTGFETIQFEFNSSVLKTEAYPTLDKLSSVLRENGGKVAVNGYASSEGTAAYNLKLSKDRANSVKTYLVNSGVNASQVVTKGYGEANPIASNDTEEGRIQNRRVETARN
ncbi:flagellar motor protein MotB [Pedobacter ginsengisoli]|uniref:Flagellar motor protein MotB n=1 Tax=Pedobacter ginsengisoli TaxID=363852 RepID=A0A2D1UCK2_9SPHI|nr:OmpA family protein [Pedobacter ginsengisoli]ATP59326.1 flagellar motor protein MotB [Pedobacter ginsengisoli]